MSKIKNLDAFASKGSHRKTGMVASVEEKPQKRNKPQRKRINMELFSKELNPVNEVKNDIYSATGLDLPITQIVRLLLRNAKYTEELSNMAGLIADEYRVGVEPKKHKNR